MTAWFCWYCTSRCVPFRCRPKMLRIMACMTQKDSCSLVLLGLHLALCSFLSFTGPRCLASWPSRTRRTRSFLAVACARLVLLVFCTSRCVSFLVGRPAARSASWPVWTSLTVTWCLRFRLLKTADSRSCSSSRTSTYHCRGAEADSHGPCDHRVSPVARRSGGRCPFLQVVQISFVAQRHIPMVQTSGEDSCAPTVAPAEKLVACSSELRWEFFRALYAGRGPRAVSTGDTDPIIRCRQLVCTDKHTYQASRPHNTATTANNHNNQEHKHNQQPTTTTTTTTTTAQEPQQLPWPFWLKPCWLKFSNLRN